MDRFTLGDSASEESLNLILGKFLPEAVMNPTQENKYQDDELRDDEEHRLRIMDTVEAVEVDDVPVSVRQLTNVLRPSIRRVQRGE